MYCFESFFSKGPEVVVHFFVVISYYYTYIIKSSNLKRVQYSKRKRKTIRKISKIYRFGCITFKHATIIFYHLHLLKQLGMVASSGGYQLLSDWYFGTDNDLSYAFLEFSVGIFPRTKVHTLLNWLMCCWYIDKD